MLILKAINRIHVDGAFYMKVYFNKKLILNKTVINST